MSRCIAFLVYPGFQILDAAGPLAAFEAAGAFVPGAYRLVVLSRDGGLVASSGGTIESEHTVPDYHFHTLAQLADAVDAGQ